jgi:predicted dehydrogenase
MRLRLGLVGIGKIARDQHLPAIAADDRFALVATASRNNHVDGIAAYKGMDEMIAAGGLDAVSLCTPPTGRFEQAEAAIRAGLHVMLEKPPAATLSEAEALAALAWDKGVTLFTTWHSREAAGVAPARAWLENKRITGARIEWKEDIRRWHPGQEWILDAGGFGVFDPGINAFSIMTAILPQPLLLKTAQLDFPEGRHSPIAAAMTLQSGEAEVSATLDFLQVGPQTWTIEVDTDHGMLQLSQGGSILRLPGEPERTAPDREYPALYAKFAELIAKRTSDVDVRPMRLVADAFLVAERRQVTAFSF